MRLFFGVQTSISNFILMVLLSIIAAFSPLWVLASLLEGSPRWVEIIVILLTVYSGIPYCLSLFYKRIVTARGTVGFYGCFFWLYASFYFVMCLLAWLSLFRNFSLDNALGVAVLTTVSGYLVHTVCQSKKMFNEAMSARYAEEREDNIQRAVEAIVRARTIN